MTSSDSALLDGHAVDLRIPADVAFVSTLRLTAASLAARCSLTVDDIEDLRLAVDEACALLLPYAADGASIDAHFVLAEGKLSVDTSVAAARDGEPDRSGLGWTVLRALASTAQVHREDDRLIITVTKSRAAAAP